MRIELLRWTKASAGSDVQDPLGLELRVSARLAGQLLYCITTITPRARYYSFLPWCVDHYNRLERAQQHDRGLTPAIRIREKALALGCIVRHEGETCDGGGVVGSEAAKARYAKDPQDAIDLNRYRQQGSTAWGQYFGSLVNLGMFVETEADEEADEDADELEVDVDRLELTDRGLRVANAYGHGVERLSPIEAIGQGEHRFPLPKLRSIGSKGGVCEFMDPTAADRDVLREVFFDKVGSPGRSHYFRRHSLLLFLHLIQELEPARVAFDGVILSDITYYGCTLRDDDTALVPQVPPILQDIAERWRMFHFHNFMGVALEALLGQVVTASQGESADGIALDQFCSSADSRRVQQELSELCEVPLSSRFLALTPLKVLQAAMDRSVGPEIIEEVDIHAPITEWNLAGQLREAAFNDRGTAIAAAVTLLSVTLLRYREWNGSDYGSWLAQAVRDPYLDLAPPVLLEWFESHYGEWWDVPWGQMLANVLMRFVVREHELLGYDKGADNSSIILHCIDDRLTASGDYTHIGIGNPRLRNALRILQDLMLVEVEDDDVLVLTSEGQRWLQAELEREMRS